MYTKTIACYVCGFRYLNRRHLSIKIIAKKQIYCKRHGEVLTCRAKIIIAVAFYYS